MRELVITGPRTKEKRIYYEAHTASGTAAEFIMNPDRQRDK